MPRTLPSICVVLALALFCLSSNGLAQSAQLRTVYAHYIVVKRCFEVRRGYTKVYVSEKQMDRVREVVIYLEKQFKEHEVDRNSLWLEANKIADRYIPIDADSSVCEPVYDQFFRSYSGAFETLNPTRKDF